MRTQQAAGAPGAPQSEREPAATAPRPRPRHPWPLEAPLPCEFGARPPAVFQDSQHAGRAARTRAGQSRGLTIGEQASARRPPAVCRPCSQQRGRWRAPRCASWPLPAPSTGPPRVAQLWPGAASCHPQCARPVCATPPAASPPLASARVPVSPSSSSRYAARPGSSRGATHRWCRGLHHRSPHPTARPRLPRDSSTC